VFRVNCLFANTTPDVNGIVYSYQTMIIEQLPLFNQKRSQVVAVTNAGVIYCHIMGMLRVPIM